MIPFRNHTTEVPMPLPSFPTWKGASGSVMESNNSKASKARLRPHPILEMKPITIPLTISELMYFGKLHTAVRLVSGVHGKTS